MCGRFYVDDEMLNEIHKICKKIDGNYHHKTGDIKPSETALMIKADSKIKELYAKTGVWGYENWHNKKLLINARVETIQDKATFRHDFEHYRCVIPVSGFYEWNIKKEKYKCKPNMGQQVLYMAGIYTGNKTEEKFTIITTAANEVMRPVHERMPLIIAEEQVSEWILGNKKIALGSNDSYKFKMEKVENGFQQMELFKT